MWGGGNAAELDFDRAVGLLVLFEFMHTLAPPFYCNVEHTIALALISSQCSMGGRRSAAIQGLRGKENVDVFILHPHKRVAPSMCRLTI